MSNNVIVGCSSTTLSTKEAALFSQLQPWGVILFSRNIQDPKQVIKLIEDIKSALGRDELIVLIDQEGGRVSRLPAKHWRVPPSPTVFARMYEGNQEIAKRACLLNAILTGLELKTLGINVNCAPMLDIPQSNSAKIIVERALGYNAAQVIELARQITTGLKRAGVAPVIKHMPGHGRAQSDSHLELPQVDATFDELNELDFIPFKALASECMAMTAHIVFNQIDKEFPATINPRIIQKVMRSTIGFDGLIMTDDINMHALSGTVAERAAAATKAGCDIALHCSGDFEEMHSLLEVAQPLSGKALSRAKIAEDIAFKAMPDFDQAELRQELDALLST